MGETQSYVDQADHHRYLDQGTDNGGKCLAGVDPEHGNRHGDGQLEIVAGGSESERGCLPVVNPRFHTDEEGDEKHHHEVDQQRNGNSHHVQGQIDNEFSFQGEHDHNGVEKGDGELPG